MKYIILYLIIYAFLSTGIAKGQIKPDDAAPVLEDLYSRLVNNYDDSDRIRINDSIRLIICDTLVRLHLLTHF
jgi:hypothetical protein